MIPYIMVEPKQWSEMIQAMEENTRLKAEVERLRKLFADTERLMLLDGEYEAAKVGTYANLNAEVERLQKLVGMQKSIDESIDAWIESKRDAAKEGKPSV